MGAGAAGIGAAAGTTGTGGTNGGGASGGGTNGGGAMGGGTTGGGARGTGGTAAGAIPAASTAGAAHTGAPGAAAAASTHLYPPVLSGCAAECGLSATAAATAVRQNPALTAVLTEMWAKVVIPQPPPLVRAEITSMTVVSAEP